MRNDYGILDEVFTPHAFQLPPLPCGEYLVTDDFGDVHKYHFRRMPRARRYTGRFGLFYHDPDAHWVLVGYINDGGTFEFPKEAGNEFQRKLSLFLLGKRRIGILRCAWCGRSIPTQDPPEEETCVKIHDTETCSKNLRPA